MSKEKKTILLPHGKLKELCDYLRGQKVEVCERVASMYLKGWYDESNEEVAQKAELVRAEAIDNFGGAEQ